MVTWSVGNFPAGGTVRIEGDRAPDRICTSRLVIVALLAQPPGVNKLFVCLFVPCEDCVIER